MTRHIPTLLFSMLLISLLFTPVLSRAEEKGDSGVPPQLMERLVSPEEYKEAIPEKAEELDLEGFLKLQAQGKVTVLDVRGKESFDRRHIKGSVNAPLTELTEKTLPALLPDKDAPVVLACDYSFMPVRMLAMTLQAYPVLKLNGYKNIYRLNLWSRKGGGEMRGAEEQEKHLAFEGSEVK